MEYEVIDGNCLGKGSNVGIGLGWKCEQEGGVGKKELVTYLAPCLHMGRSESFWILH